MNWHIETGSTTPSSSSPSTYVNTTEWEMCKFQKYDPETFQALGGYYIGNLNSCEENDISMINDTESPYPINAIWAKVYDASGHFNVSFIIY